jgi:hypothetical protein
VLTPVLRSNLGLQYIEMTSGSVGVNASVYIFEKNAVKV